MSVSGFTRRGDETEAIGNSKRANTRSKALAIPNWATLPGTRFGTNGRHKFLHDINCRQAYFLGSRTAVQAVNTNWKKDRDANSRDGHGRMPASSHPPSGSTSRLLVIDRVAVSMGWPLGVHREQWSIHGTLGGTSHGMASRSRALLKG